MVEQLLQDPSCYPSLGEQNLKKKLQRTNRAWL